MERIVGRTLQSTGRDLFRIVPLDSNRKVEREGKSQEREREREEEDLIYTMSTNYEMFLRPLEMFRKRVAYVNAFRTDFQVPTGTAAFLSRKSSYPHVICGSDGSYTVNGGDDDDDDSVHPDFVVAVAETTPNHNVLVEDCNYSSDDAANLGTIQCKVHAMSVKLDALGWTKVFVDVRDFIPLPGIPLPSFLTRGSRERWNEFLNSLEEMEDDERKDRYDLPGQTKKAMKEKTKKLKIVSSKDLEYFMSWSDRLNVPVGHQVMVANSKNPNYSSFTSRGRPVMDYFAKWLVKNLYCQPDE
jgi:hypothetical protein